jgi:hypothetical protein
VSSATVGGGGTRRVAGMLSIDPVAEVCSMTMRWPLASMGICTSVITSPSFQRTVIAVVEPKPNGRSCVPSFAR